MDLYHVCFKIKGRVEDDELLRKTLSLVTWMVHCIEVAFLQNINVSLRPRITHNCERTSDS